MPSNQFVLAYHSKVPLSDTLVPKKAEAANDYACALHRKPSLIQESSYGPYTGVFTWRPTAEAIDWPQFASSDGQAVAWVGIPEHEVDTANRSDPVGIAKMALQPDFDADSLGAPYACIYRTESSLAIVNDSLGLARIYEFDFGSLTVWATRPGLAHIFAGEYIQPNETAWAGMATLGWNVGGHTHLGSGQQLAGSTRIVAKPGGNIERENRYPSWIEEATKKGSSWTAASAGMVRKMSLGRYFPNKPIADLSGGKDSRLLAAAALSSGVTKTVRTVRSDHGEVETAERLVELYPDDITHLITEVASPNTAGVEIDLANQMDAAMRGSEGATIAATALRGPAFSGYVPLTTARFNGHGGESLHGGEYYSGSWRGKLAGRGIDGALDRLTAMVAVAKGTSETGRKQTVESIRTRLEIGREMGVTSSFGLLNYFYSSERMPLWASSSPNRSIVTPYYSSGLLHHVARTFVEETNFKEFYSEIMNSLVPAWVNVPFYRPAGVSKRATTFFWQNMDWVALRALVLDRADFSPNFDQDEVCEIVSEIDAGGETKRLEVALSRFIWELSVGYAVSDINSRVDRAMKLNQ